MQCPPSSHPNYTSGGTKAGVQSPPGRIKIAMACFRIILRDVSQTVGNSSLAQLQFDVKPTQLTLFSHGHCSFSFQSTIKCMPFIQIYIYTFNIFSLCSTSKYGKFFRCTIIQMQHSIFYFFNCLVQICLYMYFVLDTRLNIFLSDTFSSNIKL